MGTELNSAIVVTGSPRDVEAAHDRARELAAAHDLDPDALVTGVTELAANVRCSFLVAPDGGNEGHSISIRGDEFRDELVAWLREQDQRPALWDWVEVEFGGDVEWAQVLRDSRDEIGMGDGGGP